MEKDSEKSLVNCKSLTLFRRRETLSSLTLNARSLICNAKKRNDFVV